MTLETTSIFLFGYFSISVVVFIAASMNKGIRKSALLFAFLSCLGVIITITLASKVLSDTNFLVSLIGHVVNLDRDESAALLLGAAAAAPACLIWLRFGREKAITRLSFTAVALGYLGMLLFGSLIVGKEFISPYLPHPGTEFATSKFGSLAPPGFVIEDFSNTAIIPVRVAVSPDNRVYVSGHLGIAAQEGGIVELVQEDDGTVTEKLVARMLNRPYGLAVTSKHIYVSRSGQYTRWIDGKAEQISTGAVTQLTDFDNDGVMDHYHDVIVDLPGAKGPDFLHQNNGIAIDRDGALYITTANETDGHPSESPIGGVILKASGQNFENVEVYATGLRNPFGIAFDSKGGLFATDNDAQTGLLGGNLGDKLLEVNEGAFYGHPYAPDNTPSVTAPLLRSSFALGGLALADSASLPERYNDKLYIVIYGEGRVMEVEFKDDGSIELLPFATVPGAVDLAIAPNGHFYVGVYPDKIVRVRYEERTNEK